MNENLGTCLAIDLGASSGRVMAGWLTSQGLLHLEEVHRFDNIPIMQANLLTWNFDGLMTEIEAGLAKGIAEAKTQGRPVKSIGIDSWGVDFGLLDENDELLGPVVHYRDKRTEGIMAAVKDQIGAEEIFAETGIQFLPFNTIYQLAALKTTAPETLEKARHFLMIADLVAWRLTGNITCEYTNATTTQLYNSNRGSWSEKLISALDIPATIFPYVIQPGEVIGKLQGQWTGEDISVIAVATHDTGSAVVGVPAQGDEFAYISCGTWSLLGTEVPHPVTTAEALQANFTNEGGANNSIRLLKNIMGLWILQECRREWTQEGKGYSWPQLETMAREAASSAIFDVDDVRLLPPGDMPEKVRQIYREMGAPLPETDGAMVRCILESLAARYASVLAQVEDLSDRQFYELHMVGGGMQNELLCELTAKAISRPVLAGPAEATAAGNIGIQMIAHGWFRDMYGLRSCINQSFYLREYES